MTSITSTQAFKRWTGMTPQQFRLARLLFNVRMRLTGREMAEFFW
jgi:AraC-like DNA-binding protein